jgi:hypothetical protein
MNYYTVYATVTAANKTIKHSFLTKKEAAKIFNLYKDMPLMVNAITREMTAAELAESDFIS